MSTDNHREQKVADLLSTFIDQLATSDNDDIDTFLRTNAELTEELRPLLDASLKFHKQARSIKLSESDSERLFYKIKNSLSVTSNPTNVILDRRPDFLILLIYLMKRIHNLDIWGNTKLVKLLFLLGKEGKCDQFVNDFYGHYAYSYGAFDKNVPADIEALIHKGVIKTYLPTKNTSVQSVKELGIPSEKRVDAVYQLTPKGNKAATMLAAAANRQDPEILKKIEKIVRCYGKKSTDELLEYTYNTYPETAINSKIKDKFLKRKTKDDDTSHDF